MDKSEIIQNALQKLAHLKRTAYIPKTVEQAHTFSAESKFGGFPYLRNVFDWPVCPGCNKNMQLFVQLDMSRLPERASTSLLQLFYCTSEEPQCEIDQEAWSPFGESTVCRKIQVEGDSAKHMPLMDEIYPERKIVGWEAKDDYPNWEELNDMGIDMDEEHMDLLYENEIGTPLAGDKLFGWPYWVQGVEYPKDPKTGSTMQLLFQIDSEVNLPFMFGDSGAGHITQSPDNDEVLAFGWACC